jgi:hypothetical protein
MRSVIKLFGLGLVGILGCAASGDPAGFLDLGGGATNPGSAPDGGDGGGTGAPGSIGNGSGNGNGDGGNVDAGGNGNPGTNPTPGTDSGAPATPDGGPAVPPAANGFLADGLSITEVAVFQAVKVDVMKAGTQVTTRVAPVVANRTAFVRVYVAPGSGGSAHAITAELRLSGTATVFKSTLTPGGASTDDVLGSTFNFDVPDTSLPKGVTYSVALTDPAKTSGVTSGTAARYPQSGEEDILAKSSGDQLKVVIVPVQYNADGSGRVPPTDAAMVEKYRKAMYAYYPAAKVDVSVHAPYAWSQAISSSGTGFSTILQAIVKLRASDGVPSDVYYFGAFTPASSFSAYCNPSCVAGLSGVGTSPSDSGVRASVGIGFSDSDSGTTMAHEVGHAHGVQHAPCGGAASPDPNFPYSGGFDGSWGYDPSTKKLVSPTVGHDLMGYCSNVWISDYNYNKFFTRMAYVNNAPAMANAFASPRPYRFVSVGADGSASWGDALTLAQQPFGEAHQVEFQTAAGQTSTVTGAYYAYDHLPGGYMLVPELPAGATNVRITGPSVQQALTH